MIKEMSTELSRGQKCALTDLTLDPAAPLSVTLDAGLEGADVSVFGLDHDRQLHDDRYFVFYNQPRSPHGEIGSDAVANSGRATFELDLTRLPADISRLMFVVTHDATAFRSARQGRWSLGERGKREVCAYTFHGADFADEKAVMVAELYRHNGAWRLNAVGQGYNGGLDALLIAFGGELADDTSAAPTPAPVAPDPVARTPEFDRTPGGSISLKKHQTVSLHKAADTPTPLTRLFFGLGWEPAQRGRRIDLDAGCLAFDTRRKCIDKVWFMSLTGLRGAVRHSGDNLTGHGGGDDERIHVDLTRLPDDVQWLVFTVNSFSGQKFTEVGNAFCRAVDELTGRELARYDLSGGANATGMIMAKLERRDSEWHMTALGEPGGGMTVRALVKPALALL